MAETPYRGPAVFLMGPTGAGKTRLALALAARCPVEVISVDSALVYRGLDIGTAKPSPAERARVAHHLVDIRDPGETYSAAEFRADARAAIAAVAARGAVPLLVGGTGLYFRALDEGLAELPAADAALRAELAQELARDGAAALHARLAAVDPAAAARIHPNDPQRLTRALEVQRLTGRPLSELWAERQLAPLTPRPLKFVVAPTERRDLHAAIAARFDDMLERGFVNEVAMLRRRASLAADMPAMRTVGYRAIWRYLDGEYDFAAMRERGVIDTRQLAKRQLTWLRRERDCTWLAGEAALATLLGVMAR
ncbi:MAG: tRNA (adenosine(37)-N6)-dimethylallyltransferase MiaA [Gammaproteobacteria bacterium]|nr:tRNA (adenosine(37)-N6)-dimethylallyltransferase MiaA [Gammaproteobacteria bacterium]